MRKLALVLVVAALVAAAPPSSRRATPQAPDNSMLGQSRRAGESFSAAWAQQFRAVRDGIHAGKVNSVNEAMAVLKAAHPAIAGDFAAIADPLVRGRADAGGAWTDRDGAEQVFAAIADGIDPSRPDPPPPPPPQPKPEPPPAPTPSPPPGPTPPAPTPTPGPPKPKPSIAARLRLLGDTISTELKGVADDLDKVNESLNGGGR